MLPTELPHSPRREPPHGPHKAAVTATATTTATTTACPGPRLCPHSPPSARLRAGDTFLPNCPQGPQSHGQRQSLSCAGTWGERDVGTRGRGDVGTQGPVPAGADGDRVSTPRHPTALQLPLPQPRPYSPPPPAASHPLCISISYITLTPHSPHSLQPPSPTAPHPLYPHQL